MAARAGMDQAPLRGSWAQAFRLRVLAEAPSVGVGFDLHRRGLRGGFWRLWGGGGGRGAMWRLEVAPWIPQSSPKVHRV